MMVQDQAEYEKEVQEEPPKWTKSDEANWKRLKGLNSTPGVNVDSDIYEELTERRNKYIAYKKK